jgi:hypothetical protein
MQNKTFKIKDKPEWTNELKYARHIEPIALKNWVLFYSKYDSAKMFMELLYSVSRPMGIEVEDPVG